MKVHSPLTSLKFRENRKCEIYWNWLRCASNANTWHCKRSKRSVIKEALTLSFKLLSACSDWVEKYWLNPPFFIARFSFKYHVDEISGSSVISFKVFTLVMLLNSVLYSNLLLAKDKALLATSTSPSQNLMAQAYILVTSRILITVWV